MAYQFRDRFRAKLRDTTFPTRGAGGEILTPEMFQAPSTTQIPPTTPQIAPEGVTPPSGEVEEESNLLQTVLGWIQRGFSEIGKTVAFPSLLQADELARKAALEGRLDETEAEKVLSKRPLSLLDPKELEKRYKEIPELTRLVPEIAGLSILPSALILRGALAPATAVGRPIPLRIAAEAARVALAPVAGVEKATAIGLKYGIGVPLRFAGKGVTTGTRKAFEAALDTGLDRWLVRQGIRGDQAPKVIQFFLTKNKAWLYRTAQENLIKQMAARRGTQAATRAAEDTVQQAEKLLLQAAKDTGVTPKAAVPTKPAVPEVAQITREPGVQSLVIKDAKGAELSSLDFTETKDAISIVSMGTLETAQQQGFQTRLWEQLILKDKSISATALTEAGEKFIQGLEQKGFNVSKSIAPTGMAEYTVTRPPTVEAVPEVVKPKVAPKPVSEAVKLEVRRTELKELISKPVTQLPKGTKKIELRQELKEVSAKLVPAEKKLRQKIMATATAKSIPPSQRTRIFKEIGGTRHLSEIGFAKLEKILTRMQTVRPVKIGGKTVVTESTEKDIQNLKSALIGQGKLNEDAYKEIMRSLKLTTDKMESPAKFITQQEAKQLIRNMNYEAEVGLIEYDTKVIEGMKANPNIAEAVGAITKRIEEISKPTGERRTYMNWKKFAIESTNEPQLYGINPFLDIQIAIQRLQEQVGGRAVTRLSDVFEMAQTMRLHLDRVSTLMSEDIAKAVPGFKRITKDKDAMERIRLYVASKNKMAGIKSPKNITEEEVKLANAIEKEWEGWQNQLRYKRFSESYYQHDGDLQLIQKDIPNAPEADLKEAIATYESRGAEGLRTFLNTKTWGIIRQGYEFRLMLNIGVMPKRSPKVVFGKSQLKTRTDMTYSPQEKDVLQRLVAYRRRMLSSELEPFFRKIDIEFAKITPQLANVGTTANRLSLALEELKGFHVTEIATQIMLRAGGVAFSILSLSPHMFVRNLFQNPSLLPDKSAMIDLRNRRLTDQEFEFIETEVSQFTGIKQEQLLQEYMGNTRMERMLTKITYYPYSDPVNRKVAMWSTLNKAERALKDFQVDGDVDKFMRNSGMLEFSSTEQMRILELLSQDSIKYRSSSLRSVSGDVGAIRQIAKNITTRKHFRYLRFQRSIFEMGTGGRLVGSLVAFPRGYAQNLFLAAERLASKTTTAAEKRRAMKVLVAAILGSLIFGEMYSRATGKKRNPYHPLNVLLWNPGGLALGAPMAIYDTISTVQRVIMSQTEEERDRAVNQLTIDVPRMGDMFIPFFLPLMNVLESALDQQYIDRKTLREVREIFDESYTLNEEFYKKERGLLGKFQHAIFGGEEGDIPSAVRKIDTATERLGVEDVEAMEKAVESAVEKGVTDPDDIQEIRDEDWTFGTKNLASVLWSSLSNIDLDEITEDNGFNPLTVFYIESQQRVDQYYDLHETLRDRFLIDYPETKTYLYFWGRWKANISDKIKKEVRQLADKYNVPYDAIPAIKGKRKQPTLIQPQQPQYQFKERFLEKIGAR